MLYPLHITAGHILVLTYLYIYKQVETKRNPCQTGNTETDKLTRERKTFYEHIIKFLTSICLQHLTNDLSHGTRLDKHLESIQLLSGLHGTVPP